MGEVIKLNIITKLDIPAGDMLHALADQQPQNVFVIAWPEDGSPPTYHSSTADTPVVLMRIQEFIHKYYNGDFS